MHGSAWYLEHQNGRVQALNHAPLRTDCAGRWPRWLDEPVTGTGYREGVQKGRKLGRHEDAGGLYRDSTWAPHLVGVHAHRCTRIPCRGIPPQGEYLVTMRWQACEHVETTLPEMYCRISVCSATCHVPPRDLVTAISRAAAAPLRHKGLSLMRPHARGSGARRYVCRVCVLVCMGVRARGGMCSCARAFVWRGIGRVQGMWPQGSQSHTALRAVRASSSTTSRSTPETQARQVWGQMWQRGQPSPCADVAGVSPGPEQMWQG